MTSFAAAALALLLLAGGCGATGGTGEGARPEGAWQLASGRGPDGAVTPVAGHRITLLLEGDDAGGTSGCNSYGGRVQTAGGGFVLGEVSMTDMACAPAVMAVEAAYLAALQAVSEARAEDGRLVLAGPATELTFEPLPTVPERELLGTTWELDTLVEGDVASTPAAAATLRLEPDGTLAATTGCRTLTGAYVLRGDEVVLTRSEAGPLLADCGGAAARQDDHVVAVLGDGFRPQVDGDRLTVVGREGRGLVFRAG